MKPEAPPSDARIRAMAAAARRAASDPDGDPDDLVGAAWAELAESDYRRFLAALGPGRALEGRRGVPGPPGRETPGPDGRAVPGPFTARESGSGRDGRAGGVAH